MAETSTETPRNDWGLRAERDLEAGETVAAVPRSICLGLAQTPAEGESETRKDNAWSGPPCVQALVEQVPEEFADVRCVPSACYCCCGCLRGIVGLLMIYS